jgi:hypothetical protein
MAGGYALAWVKRTSKLQLSPGMLLLVEKPLAGVTAKVKALLAPGAHEEPPALVLSEVRPSRPIPDWLMYGVTLSVPVTVRLRSAQRAPVGGSDGGELTSKVAGS